MFSKHYLNEANFLGIATEALPAAHETVLPDQPMRVSTHATVKRKPKQAKSIYIYTHTHIAKMQSYKHKPDPNK